MDVFPGGIAFAVFIAAQFAAVVAVHGAYQTAFGMRTTNIKAE